MSRNVIGLYVLVVFLVALPAASAETVSGRYVHVTLVGEGRTLSLAEVQVLSEGKNVAEECPTVQTTTSHGGVSSRAVDGDTSGNWRKGTITHTAGETNPAWEVDLGKAWAIEKVVIWNRDGIESRLNGVRVSILDGRRKVVWGGSAAQPGPGATEWVVGGSARCAWMGQTVAKIVPKAATDKRQRRKTRPAKGRKAGARRAPRTPKVPVSTGTPTSLRLAIRDLADTFGERYGQGASYLKRLEAIEKQMQAGGTAPNRADFLRLQSEALLANPLLDFDKLLVVKRAGHAGLPANWLGNCSLPRGKFDDEIAVLSPVSPAGKLTTLYKPDTKEFVGDVDLHWGADKLLFSSIGTHGRWQIFEIGIDGKGLRQVSKGDAEDVDNYDGCYLPDGRIVYCSTAVYHAVPCIGGKQPVGNLYSMNADGGGVRQLCFEQDHDWYPCVLPAGHVMYTRWEYADTPHYFTRLVMTMNPDGSCQQALYGSNSYWPNSVFYARAIPGRGTAFAGIVSGHHGGGRYGELVLFDPAKAQRENRGVIQRIPGYGKPVPATIKDRLITTVWPKFLHPWPLSEKYFLVSCKLSPRGGQWGIYLVDIFDNMVPICTTKGVMFFEPVPWKRRPRPPVLAPRTSTDRTDALAFLVDIYRGPGLRDVPRGSVKKLRVLSYHFAYNRSGGHASVGAESGWDIKRVLGTVPVEADGSALFRIPANTPIAVQPLDDRGRAMQLMRSWFVGMPGETLSCVGCHEPMRDAPPPVMAAALRRKPSEIEPWRGPARPFGFTTEVRPVLNKYCVACHNGRPRPDGRTIPNFSEGNPGKYSSDLAYMSLHPYVRRPGPESDYHMLQPMEYHVSTSELFQMLAKGHHNVQLDAEAWERLTVWTDLNVPHRGQWSPVDWQGHDQSKRRHELAKLYANVDCSPEDEFRQALARAEKRKITPVIPRPLPPTPADVPDVPGWPFDVDEAARRQRAAGPNVTMSVDLGGGVTMDLVLIPAGEFVMGSAAGCLDERPATRVRIDRPFWMGVCEVTNRQYNAYDAGHDSRYIDQQWKDHALPGYPANLPGQPVIRVTWREAMAFCRWLSARARRTGPGPAAGLFALPTEAQWEWACRAGSGQAMSYGPVDADFARFANLGDATLRLLAVKGVNPKPVKDPPRHMAFVPRIHTVDDGQMIAAAVGGYQASAWGLKDMHGNVAEWTRTGYRRYPYDPTDGRDDAATEGRKVVRGGSWRDRPKRARCAFRLAYPSYQRVFNVGFRVVCEAARPVASK